MVLAKSKNTVGLGNTLMNDRFGKGKGADRKKSSTVVRTNHATGEEYLTNDRQEAAWVKMRSITEQNPLDEFLATAELAGTDFTAEKMNNVKIIQMDHQMNPFLLSAEDERNVLRKHKQHAHRLTIPRRPQWDENTTAAELRKDENSGFFEWRRSLRDLAENDNLALTPFEHNLEVWRQLWRVIERSNLVVQIVDARHPIFYMSKDLQIYVKEVDPKKENLLLVNKADMLTLRQRKIWAEYLRGAGIAFKYFSASLAQQAAEDEDDGMDDEDESGPDDVISQAERLSIRQKGKQVAESSGSDQDSEDESEEGGAGADNDDDNDDTRILTVDELEGVFLQYSPPDLDPNQKFTVGLVGYPNVGKSSTINALVGAKKVSVSATPGKTKHFQTLHLSERLLLCDCPGLVFPNFATTQADLVTHGVLPIDECREYVGPAGLVAQRIPKTWLEAMYGMEIRVKPIEEGGTGEATAHEILDAYARSKGMILKLGRANESKAARYILKDYVNGKLLWCHPPPDVEDPVEFNRELYNVDLLSDEKKKSTLLAKELERQLLEDADADSITTDLLARPRGAKSSKVDKGFFGPGSGKAGHMSMPFNYKYSEQGQAAGKALSGRKAKTMVALEKGLDPKDVQLGNGKKHFKGGLKGRSKKSANPYGDDD
jgi:large subunit GTPase 1